LVVEQGIEPEGETAMRFMILVKADKKTEAGAMPSERLLAEMGKYNEELMKAGVLRAVVDGPFTGAKDLIAGHVRNGKE
jgi:hypothetical protein